MTILTVWRGSVGFSHSHCMINNHLLYPLDLSNKEKVLSIYLYIFHPKLLHHVRVRTTNFQLLCQDYQFLLLQSKLLYLHGWRLILTGWNHPIPVCPNSLYPLLIHFHIFYAALVSTSDLVRDCSSDPVPALNKHIQMTIDVWQEHIVHTKDVFNVSDIQCNFLFLNLS